MNLHGSVLVESVRDSFKSFVAASRTKLLLHQLGGGEASVASEDPRFAVSDEHSVNRHHIETHLSQDVLHGEISRQTGNSDMLRLRIGVLSIE